MMKAIRAEKARRQAEAERIALAHDAERIRSRCQRLSGFVREAWHVLEPSSAYLHGWHIDAICAHLEAITDGRLTRLLINVPPGTMKSLIVSVFWPAWEWGPRGMAGMRYLTTSYKEDFVKRDSRRMRDLVSSEWYRALWPEIALARAGEISFANTRTGNREGVAFAGLTAGRGDRVIIDDPHSTETAESETERGKTTRIFRESVPTRLNDPVRSAIVVVMQRLHENDVSGQIMKLGLGYEHLMLPMEFEPERRCRTSIGFEDPRQADGDLLFPERFPRAVVERDKIPLGSYAVAGQFQQRPAPREGGLFKRLWFSVVGAAPAGCTWIRAWDLAATEEKPGKEPAYTAGVKMGRAPDGRFYTLAFNGDLRGVGIAHEHVITGSTTLGQPTSGYLQFPESSAEVLSVYNNSGYNSSTASNSGRTGTAGKYYRINHFGQGDLVAIQCSGFVGSVLPGATSFLANPAIECLSGDLYASANGQYLEFLGDMNLNDQGYDIAANGIVLNMRRTNAAENLGALWMGARFQNQGTQPVDAIVSATGKASAGLDFSNLDLSTYSLAQINLGAGGSGYVVGDVLTMSGGTSTVPATIKVTSVSSGAITGYSVVNAGLYSVSPATGTTTAWSGGSGTGATFYSVYTNGAAIVMPVGGCIKGAPTPSTFPNAMVRGATNTICSVAGGITIGNGGLLNSSTGAGVVQIGTSNLSTGSGSVQLGTNTYDDAQKNALLFSSGYFTDTAGYGSSQIGWRTMRGTTSTAFAIRLTTDQAGAGSQNSYLVIPSSLSSFETVCNAIDTVNGDFASWKVLNGVANRVGSANVSYTGDASTAKAPDYSLGAGSSATITITADTATQALNITFTPPTGNARKWHAQCAVRSLKIQ